MGISTYHIHNVLRTYSRKLKKTRPRSGQKDAATRKGEDWISVSKRTRRKSVIEKVTSDIVNRIIRRSPREDTEQEVSGQPEDNRKNGVSLKKEETELTYKIIDKEKGRVTKTFHIEDSEFQKDQLEGVTENQSNH